MEATHDPATDSALFEAKSNEFFDSYGILRVSDAPTGVGFLSIVDELLEAFAKEIEGQGLFFTDDFVLKLGSAIGESYRHIFVGEWRYSSKQERWVVAFHSPNGSVYEINVFNKLIKRLENGMEDSIGYHYEMTKKMYLEEYEQMNPNSNS